jgi:hypothetical protein
LISHDNSESGIAIPTGSLYIDRRVYQNGPDLGSSQTGFEGFDERGNRSGVRCGSRRAEERIETRGSARHSISRSDVWLLEHLTAS